MIPDLNHDIRHNQGADNEPEESQPKPFLKAVCILVGLFIVCLLSLYNAEGHESETGFKFDFMCCSGDEHTGDCQQIPRTSLKPISGGYQVTLFPGDHRKVTKAHTYTMEQSRLRYSPDGRVYACLWPDEATLRCLYVPSLGS